MLVCCRYWYLISLVPEASRSRKGNNQEFKTSSAIHQPIKRQAKIKTNNQALPQTLALGISLVHRSYFQ
jgi:hypothetical protein